MNIDTLEQKNSGHDKIRFSRDEIEEFARRHWRKTHKHPNRRWSGRQIKNAFQTAVALAEWDHIKKYGEMEEGHQRKAPKLKAQHFKTVATASRHFDDYLADVRQADYIRAKQTDIRDDDFVNTCSESDDAHRKRTSTSKTSKKGSQPKPKASSARKSKGRGRRSESESSSSRSSTSSQSESESAERASGESDEDGQVKDESSSSVEETSKKRHGKRKHKSEGVKCHSLT